MAAKFIIRKIVISHFLRENNRDHRLWKSGTCSCTESERIRMQCRDRTL